MTRAATGVATIQVNNVKFEWSDNSRRKPRACRGCKQPTTGRRDEIGGRSSAWCLSCTITDAFKKGGQ